MIRTTKKIKALNIRLTELTPPTQEEIQSCRMSIDNACIKTKRQIELMEKVVPPLRAVGFVSIPVTLLGFWAVYYENPNGLFAFAAGILIIVTALISKTLLKYYRTKLDALRKEYLKMETVNTALEPDLVMKYCTLCSTFGTLGHYNKRLLEQPRYPLNIELDAALAFPDKVYKATQQKLMENEMRWGSKSKA
jgi:hypothetical protein